MGIKEDIVAELRRLKIKLWLPPYYVKERPNQEELNRLAGNLLGSEDSTIKLNTLMELQSHAVKKLQQKQSLELKLLGMKKPYEDEDRMKEVAGNWAERVEIVSSSKVKLFCIKPSLSVQAFADELMKLLRVDGIRLIHKGKNILTSETAAPDLNTYKGTLMCLVMEENTLKEDEDLKLIRLIRKAAHKVRFDVTDQHGRNVSMFPKERIAFLTALGLHRIGVQRLEKDQAAALLFLLQAHAEWEAMSSSEWREKVDNYGLLQLEIAWVYLKLESIENLDDVIKRLDEAERVLRKQVHKNFVTLALAQADMGNAVPPLSAIFCRLFLLQGVAYRCMGETTKSKERLDWAFMLCQSLRSITTPEQVSALSEALAVSESQAISALRRSNGDVDKAATMIEEEISCEEKQKFDREDQRRLGLCQNTKDYVDTHLLEQLQTVLGLPSTTETGMNRKVAAGLLRLSNNDLQKAIDLYQTMERDASAVLKEVQALDRHLESRGLKKKKKVKVDETKLATLVSMGAEIKMATKLLQDCENDIEMALIRLTAGTPADAEVQTESNTSAAGVGSSVANDLRNIDSDRTSIKRQKIDSEELKEAQAIIEKELAMALNEHDLESQYFGSKLSEEWDFIQKFRSD